MLELIRLPCPHSPVENGQLPDPASWGVADVVNYFKATGFEEQASAFQDQVRLLFPLRILKIHRCQIFLSPPDRKSTASPCC